MKRLLLIKIHLYISGLSIFLLSLFILSGSLHYLKIGESTESIKIKQIETQKIANIDEFKSKFKEILEKEFSDFKYDYLKGNMKVLMTRPTSELHYVLKYDETKSQLSLVKKIPNLNKAIMEFHKGHGPILSRKILPAVGVLFLLSLISGLILGLTQPAFRRLTLGTFVSGVLLFFVLFNL